MDNKVTSSPAASSTKYTIGDLVWAKMKGFSPWPGKIVDPSLPNIKRPPGNYRNKPTQCVYFFGSNNFAWIPEEAIKPYKEFKDGYIKLNKSNAFKEAIDAIEDYIKKGETGDIPMVSSEKSIGEKGQESCGELDDDDGGNDEEEEEDDKVDDEVDDNNGEEVSSKDVKDGSRKSRMVKKSKDKSSKSGDLVTSSAAGDSKANQKDGEKESAKSEKKDDKKDKKDDKKEEKKDEKKERKERTSTSATPSSSHQRDYSRTPFKSKPKKSATPSNNAENASTSSPAINDDEPAGPPVKRSKTAPTEDISATTSPVPKSPSKSARNILDRTSNYLLDNTNTLNNQSELDIGSVSAKSKAIKASSLKFGFIGLGFMGQRLLKNLLNSGHSVVVWNRTPSKCKDFIKAGATKATTPADVVAASDVTFSCLADPHAVKEIVFGNCGVLAEMKSGKGYVEMTSIGPDTSNDVNEAIVARGGRYLEAHLISGGKQQAEEGNLTVLVSGDRSLFDDCSSCFQAISKHSFYLGNQVGDASKMGLLVSMLMGNLIGSLAESMALADRTGLSQKDLLEILSLSPLNCHTLISKGKGMIEGGFATEMPLTHMQKDLRLALQMAEAYEHPLPITASTNEVLKHAKHLGYSDHDVAAVYIRSRF